MEDNEIVALYWQRDECAVWETEKKYGNYLFKIACNILCNQEDSRECVNDTYFKAWNSMPPHKPVFLAAYLGKITRQQSIDVFRRLNREKRKGSEYTVALSELEECISGGNTTAQTADLHLLAEAISRYLLDLTPEARNTFVGRYYYMDSIKEVADYYGMSQSKVKSMLHRTRKGLRQYLEKEGFDI